jgi:DNA-binding GntR family transcriptional regulator
VAIRGRGAAGPEGGRAGTAGLAHSLAEYAQERLIRMILDRELRAGEVVIEERLADSLSISRTPLREALARLAAEGLLVKEGTRSFTVRRVSASEFFQSMRVRELLEGEAAVLAMPHVTPDMLAAVRHTVETVDLHSVDLHPFWEADDQFHELFSRNCGNEVMARFIRELRVTSRIFEASSPFGRAARDREEHLAVLDACAGGDPKALRRAMVRHIRNLQREVMDGLGGVHRVR